MHFFDAAYREGIPPWGTGRPQPAFVRLEAEGRIRSPVIDIGCGSGENALHLAARGHEVLVDISPTAIGRARGKSVDRGLDVPFLVLDALDLPSLGRTFATAVDSGVFHVFPDELRPGYVEGVRSVLDPGGRLFMVVFSERQPGIHGPRRVTQAEIRAAFAHRWEVDEIVAGAYETTWEPPEAKAWLASIVRR